MDFDTAVALMTLAELPRMGERRLAYVQATARARGLSLTTVIGLDIPVLAREFRLPAPALARLTHQQFWHRAHCRALVARLAAQDVRIVTPDDPSYPRGWLHCCRVMPPVAYAYGAMELLARPSVALLASRVVTEETVVATMLVARAAAREGCTVVVGGMKSPHRIAAAAARAAGAARIIVLDRGMFAAFDGRPDLDPFGLGPSRARFDPRATLVLSVFRPDNHAAPGSGARRDELIGALGHGIVAISAHPGGGVERICLRALDGGRGVFSWHGNSAALIAAGARPIGEADLERSLLMLLACQL